MNKTSNFTIENKRFTVDLQDLKKNAFTVRSSPRPYDVFWQESFGSAVAEIEKSLVAHPTDFLLIDANVFRLHFSAVKVAPSQLYLLDATEENKNIETVLDMIDALEKLAPSKNSTLHVVGGGITEDIGAFAACIYKRGLPWKYYPSTLLSMCDSCIGGKTGINYRKGKNQLALFSAPRQVTICPRFIQTLAKRDIHSGYGEILKLLITGGKRMLDLYRQSIDPDTGIPRPQFLKELIFGSLLVKKAVVEVDEFELDLRRSLNYGHTIGHALEALSNYHIPHGQAVALGVMIVNRMSRQSNRLDADTCTMIDQLAKALITPEDLVYLTYDTLPQLLQRDKKTLTNTFVFVFIDALGDTVFAKYPKTAETAALITDTIQDIVAELRTR